MGISRKVSVLAAMVAVATVAATAQEADESTEEATVAEITAVDTTDDSGFGDFGGDDGFGGFDDGGFSGFGGGFDDFSSGGGSAEPMIAFSGSAETSARLYPRRADSNYDTYDYDTSFGSFKDKATGANAVFTLGATYSGAYSDFDAKLKFSKDVLEKYPEDVLEEFTARVYLGNFQLEVGKMKLVWGKGDKVHVLDNFNSNDYTDFIVPDYIDRRLALPMLHAVYNAPMNVRLEAVVTPWMTPDRLAADGMWQPAATAQLTDMVTQMLSDNLAAKFAAYNEALSSASPEAAAKAYMDALTATSSFDAASLYPDTHTLKYAQGGVRTTFTIGSVDLGASYYVGHYKQPSANLQKTILYKIAQEREEPADGNIMDSLPELGYDRLQVFGLEAATVIGPLNTRAEFAYNLTNDVAGDDPWVKNNSIAWEAGFDIDLPIHNVNFNFQTTGRYVLHKDKIEDGGIKNGDVTVPFSMLEKLGYENYDVDYDVTGKYSRNQLIVDITDSFNNEKTKVELKGIYQLETKDLMVLPSVSFRLGGDDFTLSLSGLIIWCYDEDSEYYAWRNNDFASVGIKYRF